MRLIDILNKIANGELKEGTKVKYKDMEFVCDGEDLLNEEDLATYFFIDSNKDLNKEVELIEPQEPTECEHEWRRYSLGRLGQGIENHRYCSKCGIDEIEPTDNTKIEELKYVLEELQNPTYNESWLMNCIRANRDKLNEVINIINKEG